MISDADRRRLHEALVQSIGDSASEVLMELLPPAGWTDLATRTDIEIAKTELRIEMHDIRGEIQLLRTDVAALVPRFIMANIASMVSLAGLVVAVIAVT
jgi:hypothetical protein